MVMGTYGVMVALYYKLQSHVVDYSLKRENNSKCEAYRVITCKMQFPVSPCVWGAQSLRMYSRNFAAENLFVFEPVAAKISGFLCIFMVKWVVCKMQKS
ncbi:hypothetical protein QVD17_35722 [Tagetes erecta]|uniref:Uncharacterized protein n=1 Tax=Tagetes erecta TaxID=13708 RepID=A0AAD8JUX9_TARER|nr:hypothetical protein QVD17_35722 [Tagetes erecta]